jgi:hypothetical protein
MKRTAGRDQGSNDEMIRELITDSSFLFLLSRYSTLLDLFRPLSAPATTRSDSQPTSITAIIHHDSNNRSHLTQIRLLTLLAYSSTPPPISILRCFATLDWLIHMI